MLIVETIAKIRRYYFVEGKKIREISRELHVSRNTVRKVIRSGTTEHRYHREVQPRPRLEEFECRLKEMLEEDWHRPQKRKLTAHRLFELLREEGYKGGYDSIQRFTKDWRANKGSISPGSFIPLSFSPGDAFQFDWSYEWAVLGGFVQKINVAHFRLCHSRQFFVVAYPRESQEMIFDAHNRAFSFFGGVCRRGIYDNLSTAVNKILRGKDRVFNKRFLQMCSHYLVEPVACTPAAGWEKGQVEKQVQNVRSWLFTPRPRFAGFEELNGWLHDQCLKIGTERRHPEQKTRTISECFKEEQSHLIPVQVPFDGYAEQECRVSRTSLIRFDRNHYSVHSKAAGKTAVVRATASLIQIIRDGEVIGEHIRQFGRDKTLYDPWHYLPVLERKPGALRDGAPFKNWDLPPSIKRIQKQLLAKTGGDREVVKILDAARIYGIEIAERACSRALKENTVRSEVVLNLIARELDPPDVAPITTPVNLHLQDEPIADCCRYDALLGEVGHAAP